MGEQLLYLMFTFFMCLSSTLAVTLKNSIRSLLCLIMAFFNAAGVFLILRAEFIAMILVIVYVGAVCVLFLFSIMTIDINKTEKIARFKNSFKLQKLFAFFVCFILFIELVATVMPLKHWSKAFDMSSFNFAYNLSNTHSIGNMLYTEYFYVFQIAGLVLLVAMIGSIILTAKTDRKLKTQKVSQQLERSPENTISLNKIDFKQGIKL